MLDFILQIDILAAEKLHALAVSAGDLLTPCMNIISLLGNKGLIVFALSFVLMLIPKTRRTGICMFLAVGCGTVLGNGILKTLINRPRPFASQYPQFYDWWQYVGAPMKTSASFPSGHVMAIAAGAMTLYLTYRKKIILLLLFLFSFLMGFSRCYFMVHYCSDTVGGMLLGILSAWIAYCFTKRLYQYREGKQKV